MYTSIYQNSYVILVITFIVLILIFYFLEIGFTTEIKDGKVVKKFSWKYPLAISLMVWLFWHFYLYPPHDQIEVQGQNDSYNHTQAQFYGGGKYNEPKINMTNWI